MHDSPQTMTLEEALRPLIAARAAQAVVTSMSAARVWPRLADDPLDFHYLPSTMGGVVPLALGLAIAKVDLGVIAICGDGSLLMNLGALTTAAACGARNLTIVVIKNDVYEVTGGQATPAVRAGSDFVALAQAAGIESAIQYDRADEWSEQAAAALEMPGPRLVVLSVEPDRIDFQLTTPAVAIAQRIARFREALEGT
jgi:thiamine pyrophosphate-dependent acetolactate synthase large subunit-like protein